MARNKRKAKRAAIKKKETAADKGKEVTDAPDGGEGPASSEPLVSERTCTGVNPPAFLSHSRDIHIVNFSLNFHGAVLIHDTELKLAYGNRYGLNGANGSGKSTLLQVLAHREVPIQEHIDVFLLHGEAEALDINALEYIVNDVEAKVAQLEKQAEMVMESIGPDAMELDAIYERIDELDINTAPRRAGEILHGLGFTKAMMEKPTRDFSGGWRMRISLAKALFLEPDLLLLDEPTAHLDLEAVLWLEAYLANYRACLVIVSHSQDFLNSVCTHIIDLRLQRLTYYSGNYDAYVRTRRELEENQMKAYKKEQEQIKSMKDYIARFGHGSAKLARQAQSKEKILAKMVRDGLTEAVVEDKSVTIRFPDPGNIPPPVLQFTNVTFGYTRNDLLYRNLDFGVDLDSRIALVGKNGCGKSTLLKLMVGQLTPIEGRVQCNSHLRFGWYHQHLKETMDLTMSAVEYMLAEFPEFTGGIDGMRSKVGRFGLTGKSQMCPMNQLSEGQRARVVFAWLAMQNPHLLILDEPTNSIDLHTIDALADAINAFEGGVVVVSHDFRLLSQVAEEIWIADSQTLVRWEGDIVAYKEHLRAEVEAEQARFLEETKF